MNAGDTFRRQQGAHLWVVISDPQMDPNSVLVVNLTSVRGKHWEDLSCILRPGEHRFVTHDTFVYYADAKLTSNSELEAQLSSGRIQLHEPLSPEVLAKLREGARISPHLKFGYQRLLADQGLIILD